MVEMARFVKPILNMTPPDPLSLDPRELGKLLFLGKRFRSPGRRRSAKPAPAHDDERRRFPRSVVRDRRPQGDHVGVGNYRHVSGRAVARHRLRAAAPLHGRDRRGVPLVGVLARRHGSDFRRDRVGGARSGRRRSGRTHRLRHPIEEWRGHRRDPVERGRARRGAGPVERRSPPDVPEARRRRANCRPSSSRRSAASSTAARRAR